MAAGTVEGAALGENNEVWLVGKGRLGIGVSQNRLVALQCSRNGDGQKNTHCKLDGVRCSFSVLYMRLICLSLQSED